MTEQTKAQRLAETLSVSWNEKVLNETAAELRRLDANEAALLDLLGEFEALMTSSGDWPDTADEKLDLAVVANEARALITRIEAERSAK